MTDLKSMQQAASVAQTKAYAPYSKFHVGACLLTPRGQLFSGCNVENAAYGVTQCAEANAIGSMINAGEQQITEIVVIGSGDKICTPCGSCRQLLREFMSSNSQIHCFNHDQSKQQTFVLSDLLPESFGPEFLEK